MVSLSFERSRHAARVDVWPMNIKRMRLVAITALAVLLVALPASINEQGLAQVHAAMLGAVRVASGAGASRATFVAPGSAKRNASSSSHEESGMEDEAEIELSSARGRLYHALSNHFSRFPEREAG
jgi:hypothetical protein